MSDNLVTIIGAGLAGVEAALHLARRGIAVRLLEQKPTQRTPAQRSDFLAEMVCSNSFRGAGLTNAVGLLKEEMRRFGSEVMAAAELAKVPAGGALAVDREVFGAEMTRRITECPLIELVAGRVDTLPVERPLIVATGPLTGDELAQDIAKLIGAAQLSYYDAIAPVVAADSIDWDKVYKKSRYDKGDTQEEREAYVNCPLYEPAYSEFVEALVAARKIEPREFEDVRYFEGCLPIEVMAERGPKTLSFGPMKPVGLRDPRTDKTPAAVVQLRKEDVGGTALNLVGFQTRMARADQERVFRTIPGLEAVEFLRYGAIHRNTFINAPACLDTSFQLKEHPGVYFAGQITGTEGYVESAAGGGLVAHFVAERLAGREPVLPPTTTAHRGLIEQLSRNPDDYQPSNITFSHIESWTGPRMKKRFRYEAMAELALKEFAEWQGLMVQA